VWVPGIHGKEGVDGSSSSEGFELPPASAAAFGVSAGSASRLRHPRGVHQHLPWALSRADLVERHAGAPTFDSWACRSRPSRGLDGVIRCWFRSPVAGVSVAPTPAWSQADRQNRQ